MGIVTDEQESPTREDVRIGEGGGRRTWLGLAVVAVGLLGGTAAALLYRPVLASIVHPSGRRIEIVAITYGAQHRYDPRGPLRRLRHALGLVSGKPEIYRLTTSHETAVVWVRLDEYRTGDLWSGLLNTNVYDDHGCCLGWADSKPWYSGDPRKTRYVSLALRFMPHGVRRLTLDLPDNMVYGTRVTVDAPVTEPVSAPEGPALPVSASADGLIVRLRRVAEYPTRFWGAARTLIVYQPSKSLNGPWSPGWFEVEDSSGSVQRQRVYPIPRSDPNEESWTGFTPLCWEEPMWKMRVGSAPGIGGKIKPDEVWTINSVPFSFRERQTVLSRPLGNSTLKVRAQRQSDAFFTAPGKGVRLDSIGLTVEGWNKGGRIILTRVNGDSLPERLQSVGVRDEGQLSQYCVVDVPPGETARGSFKVPRTDASRKIDLRFEVYKYRVAEFTFKPERSPS